MTAASKDARSLASDPRARALGLLALLAAALVVLYVLRGVLSPIFFSLGIAYLLDPVVDRFERAGVPRAAAILVVLTLLVLASGLFLLLVLPAMIREVVVLKTLTAAFFPVFLLT